MTPHNIGNPEKYYRNIWTKLLTVLICPEKKYTGLLVLKHVSGL